MQYRKLGKTGLDVSALGFGCMRFPASDGRVDEAEAVRMIHQAMDAGVNYFDSAYMYHGGQSERILGKALKGKDRGSVLVTTKCPMGEMRSATDFDRVLNEQLRRLDTGYIDLYLLHGLDGDTFRDKVQRFGLIEKMEQAKKDGKIRHIGFSFHDGYRSFLDILDAYAGWEFCQIQMNYVDIEYQATLKGVEEAGKRGLGLVIMEPLLGGRLAKLPERVLERMDKEKSAPEWGLDFLWNRPEVSVVLSGMSSMTQLRDNIQYASRASAGMLSGEQLDMLSDVRAAYNDRILAPCTRCGYCLPCPAGIDIPRVLKAYNTTETTGPEEAQEYYDRRVEVGASACKHCGQCEEKCPQHLKVSGLMTAISGVFGR